ncbi:MAG: hypothetical protein ACI91G_000309, partial [Gammaproteobacteria bacterium]
MTAEKKRSRLSRSRSRSAEVTESETETDADTKKAKVTRGDTRQKLIDAALQRIDSERHGMVGLS